MKKNIFIFLFLFVFNFILSGCGFYLGGKDIENEDFYQPYREGEKYSKYKINNIFVYMTIMSFKKNMEKSII